jgi:hypothetical protein
MYLHLPPFWRTLLRSSRILDFHNDINGSNSVRITNAPDNGHHNNNHNNEGKNNTSNFNNNNNIYNSTDNNSKLLLMSDNQLTDTRNGRNLHPDASTTLSDIESLRSELKNMSGHINTNICTRGHRFKLPVLVPQVLSYLYITYN